MPAGLTVFLDSGAVQIDDNFVNQGLTGKYQVTIDALLNAGRFWTVRHGTLQITGTNPTVAIQSSVRCCVKACEVSGSTFTYSFIAETVTTITVYVFDSPSAISNFGLQTFKANGDLCFDSGRKYMRVVKDVSFDNYGTLITSPVPVPAGNLALVQSGFLGWLEDYHDQYENGPAFSVKSAYHCMTNIANGVISAREVMTANSGRGGVGNTQPFHAGSYAGSFLVVNVAGL